MIVDSVINKLFVFLNYSFLLSQWGQGAQIYSTKAAQIYSTNEDIVPVTSWAADSKVFLFTI